MWGVGGRADAKLLSNWLGGYEADLLDQLCHLLARVPWTSDLLSISVPPFPLL